MPDEDSLRHKYDPLPDEPRYRKKRRKVRVRSDHKHEYEEVCVDAHSEVVTRKGRFPTYHLVERCKVCGRIRDMRFWRYEHEPPESMPLYEVEDVIKLARMKYLPEDRRLL